MKRLGVLRERATKEEWMDDWTRRGPELREALRHLSRLNRLFGAWGPVRCGVIRLWHDAGRPRELTVLDAGSGSGELNLRLLKWADKQRIRMNVILADVTEEAQAEAERLFRGESRVTFVRSNVFDLAANEADIVTASQFAHHFSADRLPAVAERLLNAARIGVVLSDIHRHWLPWAAVWLATRLVSGNRYIRHDGPLSVAKGFRKTELLDLAERLGVAERTCSWRPLFRYSVTLRKTGEGEGDGSRL